MLKRSAAVSTAVALFLSILTSLASPATAATMTARQMLMTLAVAAEAGSATYDRAKFKHWTDANGDCQDARAEVLITESKVAPTFTTARRCTVAKGRWYSPYDGATWTLASDVDIDHRVALKEAWESGARNWLPVVRERFANDLAFPPSLVAITDNVNSSKQDSDPARWMPPLKANHCVYATEWVRVKYRWRMSIDATEKQKLGAVLSGACGSRAVTVPVRAR